MRCHIYCSARRAFLRASHASLVFSCQSVICTLCVVLRQNRLLGVGLVRASHASLVFSSCFITCSLCVVLRQNRLLQLGLLQIPYYHFLQLLVIPTQARTATETRMPAHAQRQALGLYVPLARKHRSGVPLRNFMVRQLQHGACLCDHGGLCFVCRRKHALRRCGAVTAVVQQRWLRAGPPCV